MRRIPAFAYIGALALLGAANADEIAKTKGQSATVVNVYLYDRGHESVDRSKTLGIGMATKEDFATASFTVTADAFAVPAGLVTFRVRNTSDHIQHQMLVVPITDMNSPLPFNMQQNRVDEEAVHTLGEVAELPPGKAEELTLEMRPGLYALLCNFSGHYSAGMWRVLAVQ